jgi:NSS family neurotransmitter:Na+ symporter
MDTPRGKWSNSFGFIMAAIGCAVGLGSIWRFPYLVGESGGGAFLLVYVAIMLLVGIIGLTVETAIGRYGQGDAATCLAKISPKTRSIGLLSVFGSFLLLTVYAIIGGWLTLYLFKSLSFQLLNLPPNYFQVASHSLSSLFWQALFMVVTALIVAGGIEKSIEVHSKWMNITLFVLLIIIVIRSVTLAGSEIGLAFYLKPNWSTINRTIIVNAIGQAFFSLSLGLGNMMTYGSYLSPKVHLIRSSTVVALSTLLIAFVAGLAIMPAVFALEFEPTQGPGLIFNVLPAVFALMPLGSIFGLAFFIVAFFAALTSMIGLVETVVAYLIGRYTIPRKLATLYVILSAFMLGIPVVLASIFPDFFHNIDLFDILINLVSNVIVPLGAVSVLIISGWFWKNNGLINELSNHGTLHVHAQKLLKFMIQIVIPFLIIISVVGQF